MKGLCRIQACIRGQIIRRLIATRFIQDQLAILAEVEKLASQFHRDILTDNIRKGDVSFHRALYLQV